MVIAFADDGLGVVVGHLVEHVAALRELFRGPQSQNADLNAAVLSIGEGGVDPVGGHLVYALPQIVHGYADTHVKAVRIGGHLVDDDHVDACLAGTLHGIGTDLGIHRIDQDSIHTRGHQVINVCDLGVGIAVCGQSGQLHIGICVTGILDFCHHLHAEFRVADTHGKADAIFVSVCLGFALCGSTGVWRFCLGACAGCAGSGAVRFRTGITTGGHGQKQSGCYQRRSSFFQ